MNTKNPKPVWEDLFERFGTPLISDDEIAQRVANLERRVAANDQALNFLIMVLDQLKETGDLVLTEAQRAEFDRLLSEFETKAQRVLPSRIN